MNINSVSRQQKLRKAKIRTAVLPTVWLIAILPFNASSQVIEEVTVTAEKRESSLQDVAVSVTALSGELIDEFGVDDFEDYLSLIPGMSSSMTGPVSNRGVRPIGLRGVQTLSGTIVNSQNTIGFYIDNSPIPAANPRLVDLERIEVLRGPQGALYSANSMGGTIVLVTKKPTTDRFSGHALTGISQTNHGGMNYEAEAAVNIPLSERAALRLSAYIEEQDGYIDFVDVDAFRQPTGMNEDNFNDMTATGARGALRVDFTDNFRLDAGIMYSKREVDSESFYNPDLKPLTWTGYFPRPAYDEFTLLSLDLNWNFGNSELVATTTYFDSESDVFTDQTDGFGPLLYPNPGPIEVPYHPYGNKNKDFSQEIRLQSTTDKPFQWLIGVFYSEREEISATTLPAPPGKTSVLGVFPWLPGQPVFANVSPRLRDERALFAEVFYDFNEQWRAVVGARAFEFDYKTIDHFIGSTLLVPNNELMIEGTAKENDIVPKLRLEYRPNDDMLFFATAAEGFRMGGANFPIPTNVPSCAAQVESIFGVPQVPDSYTSDSLWSYELGSKLTLAEGRVQLNAAVFYIDWTDQQVPTGTLCQFSGAVLNAGAVESKGFEFELQAAATDRLTFMLSGSHIDAEIKEDFQLPGATRPPFAFAGDPVPDIPEWMGAAVADYTFPAFGEWQGFVRGDIRYMSDRSGNILSTYEKDAYTEANLRLGIADEDWEVMLYIENLTDERPTLFADPTGIAGRPIAITLVPRTYGITVRRNF